MYGTKTKQIPKTPDVQKFESRENKALLWNLMYEGKVFENISPNNRVKVEGIFENKISLISNEGMNRNLNLIELNKIAMKEMILELNTLKQNAKYQNTERESMYHTNQALSQERTRQFNGAMEKKQREFNELINMKKPNEVDFSDKNKDKPIGSEMDLLLKQKIQMRNYEFNQAVKNQDTKQATDWINNSNETNIDDSNINNNVILDENKPKVLNIGDKIQSVDNFVREIPNNLQLNQNETKGKRLLSLLKRKNVDNNEVVTDSSELSNSIAPIPSNSPVMLSTPISMKPNEDKLDKIINEIAKIKTDLELIKSHLQI